VNEQHDKDPARARSSVRQSTWEWVKSIAVALVIWVVVRSLLVEAFRIPSGSMENTLLIGDFLFVNKTLYGAEIPLSSKRLPAIREPRRHDIVVFRSVTEDGMNVVKRVIGMPGDTISMKNNVLHLNGTPQEEPYVIRTGSPADTEEPEFRLWQPRYLVPGRNPATYRPTLKNWGPLIVPRDSFMVMGDNRDNSLDSRYWGFLGRDRIRGRPLVIYYSYDRNGVWPLPFLTSIRWRRIFSTPE
jgi:signal peptidase I